MLKLKVIRNDNIDELENDFNIFTQKHEPVIMKIDTHMTHNISRSYHFINIYYYTKIDARKLKIKSILTNINEG